MLLSIKIHEIAKKLNLNSKEVLEKAKELGFDIKSHLSSVADDVADKIESGLKRSKVKVVSKKEETKKEKNSRSCNY